MADGHARLHEEHHLTKAEMMEEEFFLVYVSSKRFEEKFGLSFSDTYGDIVENYRKMVSWSRIQRVVRMTKRGLFLGDSVARQFILRGLDGD